MLSVVPVVGCTSHSPSRAASDCSYLQAPIKLTLPDRFPTPRGVTYIGVLPGRATTVVHAFSASPVGITYDLYRRDLASDPYQVTASKTDGATAQVAFRSRAVTGSVDITPTCGSRGDIQITINA